MRTINKLFDQWIKISSPFLYFDSLFKNPTHYSPIPEVDLTLRPNTFDKYLVWETWKYHVYDLPILFSQTPTTIIDIGAHVGSFSLYAASLNPKAKIQAFEPHPENYRLLLQNIKQNHFTNIIPHASAIVGKRSQNNHFLFSNSSNTGGHSLIADDYYRHGYPVSARTLTEVVHSSRPPIDYLKIDTEGSEYDIILNTPHKVLSHIKFISIEFHDHLIPSSPHLQLTQYLSQSGFSTSVKQTLTNRLLKTGMITATNNRLIN